jgi:uncharacterized membrane protein
MILTPLIAVHMTAAIAAIILGPVALWARKGRIQRPKLHRAFGYAWVTLMIMTAVTAMFIRDFRLPNIAGYTPIHLLIPLTLFSLTMAFYHLSQGNIIKHKGYMTRLYWSACVVAGGFTLLPGRYLGNLVWGLDNSASAAPSPSNGMLSQILNRTPVWVWGLLAVLIALGVLLSRPRVLSFQRLVIVPVVMTGLSLLGTLSAAGLSLTTITAWAVAYGLLATALSRKPALGDAYDANTQRFTVSGSYTPLAAMMAIFITKYAVGVLQGMNAQLVHSAAFPIVVAALYGAFSGFFAGRALRVIKLNQALF